MRFAIIGCGAVASRYHLPALLNLNTADVVAVVDLNRSIARKTAKKFSIKRYHSEINDVLLDNSIDVVVIATPTPTHAELAIKVANAGKNIIIEKPLALTLSDGFAVKRAAEKNRVKLSVVQNYRYVPTIKEARTVVRKGLLGSITSIYGVGHTPWPNQWTRSTWLYYPPGLLFDFAPHVIDAILWVTGKKPKKVYTVGGDFTGYCNFVNYAHISIVFDKRGIGTIDLSWLSGTFHFSLSFTGTSGRIDVDPRFNTLFEIHGVPTPLDDFRFFLKRISIIKDVITGRFFLMPKTTYLNFYADFINAVDKGLQMPVTVDEALESLAVLDGAYKSIHTGKVIDINI